MCFHVRVSLYYNCNQFMKYLFYSLKLLFFSGFQVEFFLLIWVNIERLQQQDRRVSQALSFLFIDFCFFGLSKSVSTCFSTLKFPKLSKLDWRHKVYISVTYKPVNWTSKSFIPKLLSLESSSPQSLLFKCLKEFCYTASTYQSTD